MLLLSILALLLAVGVAAVPSPTIKRQQSLFTIKWASAPSLFFEFDRIFTTPIYTPTPIRNGIKPYLGQDAPKFFYRNWEINNGQIAVTGGLGERKCLDAGVSPGDGSRVHMWDCYNGLTQQQWIVENGRIRLRDDDLCLDVPNGNPGSNYVQVWECTAGPNQNWVVTPL